MKEKQKAFQLMVKMISSEEIYLLIVMKLIITYPYESR